MATAWQPVLQLAPWGVVVRVPVVSVPETEMVRAPPGKLGLETVTVGRMVVLARLIRWLW